MEIHRTTQTTRHTEVPCHSRTANVCWDRMNRYLPTMYSSQVCPDFIPRQQSYGQMSQYMEFHRITRVIRHTEVPGRMNGYLPLMYSSQVGPVFIPSQPLPGCCLVITGEPVTTTTITSGGLDASNYATGRPQVFHAAQVYEIEWTDTV
jgi:hypothetical protein